jgi:hypothetical protein
LHLSKKENCRIYLNLYRACVASLLEERSPQDRDYKNSLADVLAPQVLSSWLEAVAGAAREICPGSGVRYEKGGYCGEIIAPTRKDKECVIKAIDGHIGGAPEVARRMLASYRERLQESPSESNQNSL